MRHGFEDQARRAGADLRHGAEDWIPDVPAFGVIQRRRQRRRMAVAGSVAGLLVAAGIVASGSRDDGESVQLVTDPPAVTTAPFIEHRSTSTTAPATTVAPSTTTVGPEATDGLAPSPPEVTSPPTRTVEPVSPTTTVATAPPPEANLSRNGPEAPVGQLWPRDDPDNGPDQLLWLEGYDVDGWVVEMVIDWRDGSPPETYRRSLDFCGPYENADQDDPYPSSDGDGKFRQQVSHVYPQDQVSFEYVVTVTSVSCTGDEAQVVTTTMYGGVSPSSQESSSAPQDGAP